MPSGKKLEWCLKVFGVTRFPLSVLRRTLTGILGEELILNMSSMRRESWEHTKTWGCYNAHFLADWSITVFFTAIQDIYKGEPCFCGYAGNLLFEIGTEKA